MITSSSNSKIKHVCQLVTKAKSAPHGAAFRGRRDPDGKGSAKGAVKGGLCIDLLFAKKRTK